MKSKTPSTLSVAVAAVVLLASARAQEPGRKSRPHTEPDLSKLPPPAKQQGVTYAKDIRPLFEASCFRCHGGEKQKGDLRLDSLEAALKGGEDGKVVVPGQSAKSPLVIAVARLDEETAMPPMRKPGGRGPGGPGGPPGRGGRSPGEPGTPPVAGENAPGGSARGADRPKSPAEQETKPMPQRGGPGGPGGFGGPGGPGGGPMSKPLTAEQVSLIRAWIDQGAR